MQRRGLSADIVTNPRTSERNSNVVFCDSNSRSHNANHFKHSHHTNAQSLTISAKDLMLKGNGPAPSYGSESSFKASVHCSRASNPSGKAMFSTFNPTTSKLHDTHNIINGNEIQDATCESLVLCHQLNSSGGGKYPSPSESSDSDASHADSLLDGSNGSWSSQSSCSSSSIDAPKGIIVNKLLTPAAEGAAPSLPSLCKESVRQYSYVDSLVDVATIITATLWPSEGESGASHTQHGLSLIGHFITETSRKSKTSLSTMQLALLYCIRFKRDQNNLSRAILELEAQNGKTAEGFGPTVGSTCARRNFLSALILASKYLQDRNFSNKAWSKISSVSVSEINLREREFLEITRWNLDVKHDVFQNWSSTMEGFVCQVRDDTILGGLDSCQGKWTALVQRMMLSSDAQMNQMMGQFASTGIIDVNEQLETPLATPLVELQDFVLPTVVPADPAEDWSSGTSSAPSVSSSPGGIDSSEHLEDDCRCPFFEEFIKSTPYEHNLSASHLMEKAVYDGPEGQYATPESLRTVSPALTENDQFNSQGSTAGDVSCNEEDVTAGTADRGVPPTPKASLYGSFSVTGMGDLGMDRGQKRRLDTSEKEAGCNGTQDDGFGTASRRRKALKRNL
ncbi:protein of unknown function [Taphrina deformans PYCC 5710]|uniref:Cyclin N-terminal domain-containing protein n=1 Tax=Taphrina deformans (strain PYCC 5710 / ATCC 11124 / CBS 356.35 / IMI 108563 / JCM 9778 / NBRC 8474) TaxID=1097556 RepID=R4XEW5_TAPDE|nr:protein of unknown function [Taphrina deformans PYCC 5710]|eukprot:CCG84326.1 protein of unknown function [Taphrina deformans PYCC 5710]